MYYIRLRKATRDAGSTRDQDLYPKRQHMEGPSKRLTNVCRQQAEASITMRTHGLLVLHMAALLSYELYLLADERSCCLHLRQAGSGAASSGSGAWERFDAEQGKTMELLKVLA